MPDGQPPNDLEQPDAVNKTTPNLPIRADISDQPERQSAAASSDLPDAPSPKAAAFADDSGATRQAANKKLPDTFDDFLKSASSETPQNNELPSSFDDFLKKNDPSQKVISRPISGPGADAWFSATPALRITGAALSGGAEAFGSEKLGITPEWEKALRNIGVFDDYKQSQDSIATIAKQYDEAFIRPAIVVVDALWRTMKFGYGVYQGTAVQVGKELDTKAESLGYKPTIPFSKLGQDIASIPESMPTGIGAMLGIPHPPVPHEIPPDIAAAADARVIGPGGHDAWEGTAEAPSLNPEVVDAVQAHEVEQSAVKASPEPKDIHTVVRQQNPALFNEYDDLATRRDTFGRWMGELRDKTRKDAAAPHQAEIDALNEKMDDATPRLQKKYAARIDKLTEQRDTAVNDALRAPNAVMDSVRAAYQAADYRMRDMAVDVSKAYRDAQEQLGTEAVKHEPVKADQDNVVPPEAAAEVPKTEPTTTVPIPPTAVAGVVGEGAVKPGQRLPEENDKSFNAKLDQWENQYRSMSEDDRHTPLGRALNIASRPFGVLGTAEKGGGPLTIDGVEGIKAAREAGREDIVDALVRRAKNEASHTRSTADSLGKSDPAFERMSELAAEHESLAEKVYEEAATKKGTPTTAEADVAPGTQAATATESAKPQYVAEITNDVTKKLTDAGRPEPEARAAAAVVSAYYETRAARFGGQRGTAAELYNAEAPEIRVGQQRARELAQGPKGKIRLLDDGRKVITLFKDADASTFMHEVGHGWLEDLLADSEHELAPDDLRADAKTVRDWLGAEDGEPIKTRQHEKFARGFERYMMEGIAPSKTLAKVFSQFKTWLTNIYQSVKALKSPISDDIRQVFDRMLAEKPERTVIAPEREPVETFADIHESDAATTPPHMAGVAAENMRSEIDEIAETNKDKLPPGTYEKLVAAGRPEPVEGENAGAAGGADGTKPEPGIVSPAAQPRTVPEIGNQPAPKSPDVGGTASEGSGSAISGSDIAKPAEQPTGPNEHFSEPESNLVDKAGNFRLENIKAPQDVKEAIRQSVDRNGGFVAERRNVVTDQQAMASLAESGGMTLDELKERKIGDAFNKEQIIALEQLFIQTATDAKNSARAAKDAGTDEAYMAYAEAEARQNMILDTVAGHTSGVRAEAGRALQAFNALKNMEGHLEAHAIADVLKEQTGTTLFQIKRRANAVAEMDTPAKINGAARAVRKPGAGAYALEIFKNWLISGPITHMAYAIGNEVLSIWKAIPETAAKATVGAIRESISGEKRPRVYYGEIGAQLKAISDQHFGVLYGQKTGWRAAWDSFRAGQTVGLPHEMLDSLSKGQRVRYDDLVSKGATYEQAMAHLGVDVTSTTPFTATKDIPNPIVFGVKIPIGSAVRFPGERMVAPIHSFYRSIGYAQAQAAQAYRTAMSEGLVGDAFNKRVADLMVNSPEKMMEISREESSEQTLMGKNGQLTGKLAAVINWEPTLPLLGPTKPLGFVDPFIHVASNVANQAFVKRGFLGPLSEEIRADLMGRNGPLKQDTAQARLGLGVSLAVLGGGLALGGIITKSAPSDPKQAELSRRVDGMPHSIKIGNMSYDLSRLGVIGVQLGLAADLSHAITRIGKDDAATVMTLLVESFTHNLMNEGMLRGPSDLLKAIDEPGRYGKRYVYNFLSSMIVPYSVAAQQISQRIDPYARDARTFMDQLKAKIPWVSESLNPRLDVWGEAVPNREFYGVYAQQVKPDPTDQFLKSVGYAPSHPDRKLRGIEMTGDQYTAYSRDAGRLAKLQLDKMIPRPWFTRLSPTQQHDEIQKVITAVHEKVAQRYLLKWRGSDNDILKKATEAKRQ